jgi:hypothetical protein
MRKAFLELIEGGVVPGEVLFDNEDAQDQWNRMDNEGQIQSLTGWLWYCTDVMPNYACSELDMPHGSTYAEAAQIVRQQ